MKTLKFKIAFCALCVLIIYACSAKKDAPIPNVSQTSDIILGHTVPDSLFLDNISRWKTGFRKHMEKDSLFYFNMPTSDLKGYVNEKHVHTRFYIGMDKDTNLHLFLVGTDGTGHILQGPENHIYDVTTACPRFCDEQ